MNDFFQIQFQMQLKLLEEQLKSLAKNHSINKIHQQQIICNLIDDYKKNANPYGPNPNYDVVLKGDIIDNFIPILIHQTIPFFEQQGLPTYATRNQYNLCETKQILFHNNKPLSQDDVLQLASFCENIMKDHPSLLVFTPFKEGIFGIHPTMDIYYKQTYYNDKYVYYQLHLLAHMSTPGNQIAYLYRFGCEVKLKISTNIKADTKFTIRKPVLNSEFYKPIRTKSLGWNDMDKEIFTQTLEPYPKNEMERIVKLFTTHIMITNALLYYQKQKHPRKVFHTTDDTHPIPVYIPKEVLTSHKKIIMDIQTNEDINDTPAMQSAQTDHQRKKTEEIHYQTPSWQVRGYVRHYKNGKSIFIQPSVRKRKEIKDIIDAKPSVQHITFETKKGNHQ